MPRSQGESCAPPAGGGDLEEEEARPRPRCGEDGARGEMCSTGRRRPGEGEEEHGPGWKHYGELVAVVVSVFVGVESPWWGRARPTLSSATATGVATRWGWGRGEGTSCPLVPPAVENNGSDEVLVGPASGGSGEHCEPHITALWSPSCPRRRIRPPLRRMRGSPPSGRK